MNPASAWSCGGLPNTAGGAFLQTRRLGHTSCLHPELPTGLLTRGNDGRTSQSRRRGSKRSGICSSRLCCDLASRCRDRSGLLTPAQSSCCLCFSFRRNLNQIADSRRAARSGDAGGNTFVLRYGRLAFDGDDPVLHTELKMIGSDFRFDHFGANRSQNLAIRGLSHCFVYSGGRRCCLTWSHEGGQCQRVDDPLHADDRLQLCGPARHSPIARRVICRVRAGSDCRDQTDYTWSTSRSQSGRFSTSRGLLPSGGPMMPSRYIMSSMRAARP